MTQAEIEARLAVLYAAQEAATGWGAAVGARAEEIRALESQLGKAPPRCSPDIVDVLAELVACNDAFWAGNRDQAGAYYSMIKGKDKLWERARAAVANARSSAASASAAGVERALELLVMLQTIGDAKVYRLASEAHQMLTLRSPDVAQGKPDGWVLAPKEPTDAMCEAMLARVEEAQSGNGAPFKWPDIEHMFDIYTDAIAASSLPSTESQS